MPNASAARHRPMRPPARDLARLIREASQAVNAMQPMSFMAADARKSPVKALAARCSDV
jgi:hypothetical protein